MNKLIKKFGAGLVAVFAMILAATAFVSVPAYAATGGNCDSTKGLGGAVDSKCSQGSGQASTLFGDNSVVNTIINTMLFIVGILSVVMIIFSGIRYVTAHGDKSQVEGAKNTLIYAVVGLIIAIVAYALVNWVTGLWGNK